jgi:hypothetical protein
MNDFTGKENICTEKAGVMPAFSYISLSSIFRSSSAIFSRQSLSMYEITATVL